MCHWRFFRRHPTVAKKDAIGARWFFQMTSQKQHTVKDRRPLIGLHPKHPQLAVFNGMGTKAVMLAPYFAIAFSDFLETGKELNSEVDIKRYYTLENQTQY